MKQAQTILVILISIMVLSSCGDSGRSHSGANMQRLQTSISCQREGNKNIAVGDQVKSQFTISPIYAGTAKLITLCDLEVISDQTRTISTRQLDVTTTLPEECGGLKTLTVVLALSEVSQSDEEQSDVMAMCSWSQNIISPIIEEDVRRVVGLTDS